LQDHPESAHIAAIPGQPQGNMSLGTIALAASQVLGGLSSRLFAPSVYRGAGHRRSIALTFDDGPSPGTMELLEYLDSQNVPATFFQCGQNILRHPDIARAVHLAGHEIGNHTFSHPRLPPRLGWQPNLLSPSKIFDEFAHTQTIIQTEIGANPTLLRAPYGLAWFGLRAVQRQLNLLGVMWTVIGRDWELPAAAIADIVLQRTAPRGIICLHDGRETRPNPDISHTIAALRIVVPQLRDRGYTFETASDLLRPDAPGEDRAAAI
jgi:peptidoglycan/xylan/chitin deacetylase (PgdA/CDA1 family)